MSLFNNIFGKKSEPQEQLQPVLSQSLFVETEAPVAASEKKQEDAITLFLEENHFAAGLYAGYNLHCHDGLKIHLGQLRARFREAVDALTAGLEKLVIEKEMIQIQIGDMMPSQKQCLDVSIDQDKKTIEEAKFQKVLSIDDEGWISSAVSSFKLGYQKGMMDYFNEKDFFKAL